MKIIVHGQHILGAFIMTILQALLAYRDKLALVAGSAAALGEPRDRRIPEDILFPVHDTLDIRLQIIIFMNRNGLFEITDGECFGEIIFPAELSILRGSHQVLQHLTLHRDGIVYPFFDAPLA